MGENRRDLSAPPSARTPREAAAESVLALAGDFAGAGTFWEVGNFMAGWDPHFGFKDWLRVFRTVPSLRKYLLPALAWNVLLRLGGRKGYPGYSERYVEGRKYNFRYRSFCTDFLLWESMDRAAVRLGAEIPEAARMALASAADLVFRNRYEVPWEGGALPMFSYFPRYDHGVPPGDPVHRMFFSRDDNVPDIDTTALILGSLLGLRRLAGADAYGAERSLALLGLMEQHVHGRGRFGRKSLSYDNGVHPADRGVMTWVFDDHNELDPTSNVNILNWLVLLPEAYPGLPRDRIAALAGGILEFLLRHARDGSLLDPRFQSYYPLGPAYFFWRRFMGNFLALAPGERERMDPSRAVPVIDACLAGRGEEIFRPGIANPFDRLAAAPFLYEHGIHREEIRSWLDPENRFLGRFRNRHYEIFHLRYPSKIFCAPLRFPEACALELALLVDKNTAP